MQQFIKIKYWSCFFITLVLCLNSYSQRTDLLINQNWQSKLLNSKTWKTVNVPHNWDQYYGYRRLVHGNLHDTAIYKKTVLLKKQNNKKYFLQFEGVGSYATVFVNNKNVGNHAGGRTSFTLDITAAIQNGKNDIEVIAAHPANINNLPWVCGGCSNERGFSEGSQPLGIFRNVHLITTNDIFIKPFGVYAYAKLNKQNDSLFLETSLSNFSNSNANISVQHILQDKSGKNILEVNSAFALTEIETINKIEVKLPTITKWSIANPYLYKIVTKIYNHFILIDNYEIDFGFRTITWKDNNSKLFINDEQVFVNGVAEYEHLMGNSHSFSKEQINSRIKWIQSAGFNAFRDAHQPHNLLYGKLLNQKGILWWSQFSAHVWYDTEDFKTNFKKLLKEWVLERRNDPALFLWGIQNESKLPTDFTSECSSIIRQLDATASSERLITTCNGGSGADWDVPQNWSGTYGGNLYNYGDELKKQKLVGEYGAWRTLGLHDENAKLTSNINSEEKACMIIEEKI
jgi:beta-galactosidase